MGATGPRMVHEVHEVHQSECNRIINRIQRACDGNWLPDPERGLGDSYKVYQAGQIIDSGGSIAENAPDSRRSEAEVIGQRENVIFLVLNYYWLTLTLTLTRNCGAA